MTDLKKTIAHTPDNVSGAVYQLAKLYELWTQDRTDLMKRVSQLETQNERLEHILSKFATVDEDFKRTLRALIEKESHRLGKEVGEAIGASSAKAAKEALEETTTDFTRSINHAIRKVNEVDDYFSHFKLWTIVFIFLGVFASAAAGAILIHWLKKDQRLTTEESALIRQGAIYSAASTYLTLEEQDKIYGLARYGKDYVPPKIEQLKPSKKQKVRY